MTKQQAQEQVFECVECGGPVHVLAEYVRGGSFICPKCEEKVDDAFWEALHG